MRKWLLFFAVICSLPLFAEKKVLLFAGSTREASYNKLLVREAARIAKESKASVKVVDLRDYPIPYYDGDLEEKRGMPAKAQELRKLMMESDAILIASPCYNASISAVLKNVLDWASRDVAGGSCKAALKGKKIGMMSASPGKRGGEKGLIHLKAILLDMGGTVLSQQVVVSNAYNAFDESGKLKNAGLKTELRTLVQAALAD